ncbi:MAG: hypothetical protein NT072_03805 [Deltaproteobacteria bacterium]|nr:hypothetical protein [Deltaproteobacteria bacterium]
MNFFNSMEITIPLSQVAMLLTFSTIALLLGRKRLALIVCYIFTVYWGSIVKLDTLMMTAKGTIHYGAATAYYAFGFIVLLLACIGFIKNPD